LIVRRRRNYNRIVSPISTDPDRLRALVAAVRDFVLRAKRSLDDEIRSYPTPIPRCDAQFNHAYEQRARLAALLQRIDEATSDAADATEPLRAMAELSTLPAIGETREEEALRARIADALAGVGPQIVASRDRSKVDVTAGGR